MRDIVASPRGADAAPLALPNRAEGLAARALGAGPTAAHDALAGADHADAQPVEDRSQLGRAHVEPAAGPAGSLDVPDDALALRPVLQEHPQDRLGLRQVRLLDEVRVVLLVALDAARLV